MTSLLDARPLFNGLNAKFLFFIEIVYNKIMQKLIELKNVVWKEGKYYVAQCLNVDVSSFGKTKKEALDNLQEALELYFEHEEKPRFEKIEHPSIETRSLEYA